MKKIKGYRKFKENYIHKKISKEETKEKGEKICELIPQPQEQKCFALVVVRKIPWYKKFVRNIRNLIVIYRWRKAR